MSQSSAFLPVVPRPRAAMHLSGSDRPTLVTPRRVREWSKDEPIILSVLDGARELRFVSADDLPLVVRALERAGHVVVVRYDGDAQRLVYYAQRARLPGPVRSPSSAQRQRRAAMTGDPAGSVERDAGTSAETHRTRPALPTSEQPSEQRLEVVGYEDEGTQQVSRGSVAVASGAWWSAAVTVAGGGPGNEGGAVFLRLERHGALMPGYQGDADVDLSLPRAEIDAVLTLLAGVVAQARRDGVLPANDT